MRKQIIAITLMTVGLLSGVAHADAKFAVADLQEAIMATEAAKKAKASYAAAAKPQQDRVEALRKDLQTMQARYKKDEQVMSPKDKEALSKQMESKVNEYNTIIQTQQRKAQEAEQELAQRFVPKLKPILQDLRKAGGYDIILDRKTALDLDPAMDLTTKITEKLNAAK